MESNNNSVTADLLSPDVQTAVLLAVQTACSSVSSVSLAVAQEATRPSVLMKPGLDMDGTKWCASYGTVPHAVCGFGDTVDEAMKAFDAAWVSDKTNVQAVKEKRLASVGLIEADDAELDTAEPKAEVSNIEWPIATREKIAAGARIGLTEEEAIADLRSAATMRAIAAKRATTTGRISCKSPNEATRPMPGEPGYGKEANDAD